jgi:hypothetical protein
VGVECLLGQPELDVAVAQVDHMAGVSFHGRLLEDLGPFLLFNNGLVVFVFIPLLFQAGTSLQVHLPELFPRRHGSRSGFLRFVIEIGFTSFFFVEAREMYQEQLFPAGPLLGRLIVTVTDSRCFAHDDDDVLDARFGVFVAITGDIVSSVPVADG